jgi:hypothetical protein
MSVPDVNMDLERCEYLLAGGAKGTRTPDPLLAKYTPTDQHRL